MIKGDRKPLILFLTMTVGVLLGDLAVPALGADIEIRKVLYLILGIVLLNDLLNNKNSFRTTLHTLWPYTVLILIFVNYSSLRSISVAIEIIAFTAITVSLYVLYSSHLIRIKVYFWLQTLLTLFVILASLINNLVDLFGIETSINWGYNVSYVINGVWKREALLFKESTTFGFLMVCIAPFYIRVLLRTKPNVFYISGVGYAICLTFVGSFLATISILTYLLLAISLLDRLRRRACILFLCILTGSVLVNVTSRALNTSDIYIKFGTIAALVNSYHTYSNRVTESGTESGTESLKLPKDYGGSLVLISHLQSLRERFNQEPVWKNLLGQGIGNYQDSYLRHIPEWSKDLWGPNGLAANDGGALAIRLLVETGIIGFLVYVTLCLNLLNYIWKCTESVKKRLMFTLHIAMIAAFMLIRIPFYDEPIFYLTLITIISLASRFRAQKPPLQPAKG